ncbi:hypothetical protein FS749_005269 [Ceratobasidium sp. UAMH 11750]|nr:hypothetical protein FS749_005269 [Ceratobasidium sp. UAMH 11750]
MPEEQLGRTKAQISAAGLKQCPHCDLCFKLLGFERHVRVCRKSKLAAIAALRATVAALQPHNGDSESPILRERQNSAGSSTLDPLPISFEADTGVSGNEGPSVDAREGESILTIIIDTNLTIAVDICPPNASAEGEMSAGRLSEAEPTIEEGTIRIVHLHRPNRLHKPEVYLEPQPAKPPPAPVFTGDPWCPFRNRQDFEFANVALDAGLSRANTNTLLRLFHESNDCKLTLKNYEELRDVEKQAAKLMAPFEAVPFQVPYKPALGPKTDRNYEALVKPLHEWLTELIHDESVQQQLQFDAQKKYRWTEGEWRRVIDEPWTTDEWERKQNLLPVDGLPLNIHLYADRAAVSMFGQKKVYPVVARLANLPREIRNGKGVGGGRVVALLPVVEEPATETGRTALADLKCAVWHAGLDKLVDSIQSSARVGHAAILKSAGHIGLDGTHWQLFPSISIIAADYEEQVVMACHRGLNSKCPCIRCLVPAEELHNLDYKAKMRDPGVTGALIKKAQGMSATKAEDFLKPYSLRPIQNVFLTLGPSTNPFTALSYDTLHNDDLGRWGKHLWPLLKGMVNQQSTAVVKAFESRVDLVPPWSGLNHFANPLRLDLSDGQKYYDLLKVVLHGTLGLPDSLSPLIALIRVQAELRLLAGLEVQTDETITLGRETVKRFYDLSQACGLYPEVPEIIQFSENALACPPF